MPSFTDQLGDRLELPSTPRRIISLVPSQTELLFDLGLAARVLGVTQFCLEPADGVRDKIKVGGTKRFLFERIDALEPDLILANKEENYLEGIEKLRQRHPVWVSDILALPDAVHMIGQVGAMTGESAACASLVQFICSAFKKIESAEPIRVAYLIWKKPWMVAAADTFIDDMLRRAGLVNVFDDQRRYPETTIEELCRRQPEFLLLSSEPYPFVPDDAAKMSLELGLPALCVDAMPFSWYGRRLQHAPAYFRIIRAQMNR